MADRADLDRRHNMTSFWNNTDNKTEIIGENPDPVPLGPPQTSHITDGQNHTSFTEISIK